MVVAACGERGGGTPGTPAEILTAQTTGLTYLQQDRLVEARAEFTRLISLAPNEAVGHANLALVHLKAGEIEEAERAIRRALEIEPDNAAHTLTLARIAEEAGRRDEASRLLEASAAANPDDARTLWALAELAGAGAEARARALAAGAAPGAAAGQVEARATWLGRTLDAMPGNLTARFELARALLESARADSAIAHLEALRQQAPDFRASALAPFQAAIDSARAGSAPAALRALDDFGRYFESTSEYQAAAQDLRGPAGTLTGIPQLAFSHAFSLRVVEEEAVLASLRYADASQLAGLLDLQGPAPGVFVSPPGALALGDFDGDGDEDLFFHSGGFGTGGAAAAGQPAGAGQGGSRGTWLLRSDLGRFVDVRGESGLPATPGALDAVFGDVDGDRRLDLFVVGPDGGLFINDGDGGFTPTALPETAPEEWIRAALVDLDLDGDLDIYVASRGPNRFFRNNGDGTFGERAAAAGIAGDPEAASFDVAFADFDDDRDVDLAVASADGLQLYTNLRGGRFEEVGAARGLPTEGRQGTVAAGDFDNDGWIDLFLGAGDPEGAALYRNTGRGSFERYGPTALTFSRLAELPITDAAFLDFDNDTRLDLVVAGIGGTALGDTAPAGSPEAGLRLLRNTGDDFEDANGFLPPVPQDVRRVAFGDYNEDGDLDLFILDASGRATLLRNDGANANHYLRLDLVGLGTGSGKNNRFGIGARVEVRAGEILQVRTATRPYLHFGLDGRLKADVIRVEWPNGVGQDLYFPGTDQDLIEQQTLKGSCPFVYAWNGERYEFTGDVMWRSAIGMPLGILGGDGTQAYAPPFPSQEYRRLPDGVLVPRDGVYALQFTGELWETLYTDEVKLVAVDHPDSVEIRVDEKFVPPVPASLRLWRVGERHAPVAARDDRGVDHLETLRERDFRFVSNLVPGRYQGTTEMHDLILDLGPAARAVGPAGRPKPVVLYLTGWIFPTDASINVAMSQNAEDGVVFPYLQVKDGAGEWRTVIEDLGFPAGKDKTVVVDLSGLFPGESREVRIRTSAQIYWDRAFFAVGPTAPASDEVRVTALEPSAADLHYRGFSREYRKGGRYGPHWFDYDDVTTEPKWHDLEGLYTRYGDVRPLLLEGDDMYVISNAGDEITLSFAEADLPDLPEGWTRTFLLYTDGWVKDGDLNTAEGWQVEPLPFRAATRYPHGPEEAYPNDAEHHRYREAYTTRRVDPDRF